MSKVICMDPFLLDRLFESTQTNDGFSDEIELPDFNEICVMAGLNEEDTTLLIELIVLGTTYRELIKKMGLKSTGTITYRFERIMEKMRNCEKIKELNMPLLQ
jgi:DNA-directed RNA polymerase specialized sigma24 family protein